eukprot:7387498-Prymnesium_polylepis.1
MPWICGHDAVALLGPRPAIGLQRLPQLSMELCIRKLPPAKDHGLWLNGHWHSMPCRSARDGERNRLRHMHAREIDAALQGRQSRFVRGLQCAGADLASQLQC